MKVIILRNYQLLLLLLIVSLMLLLSWRLAIDGWLLQHSFFTLHLYDWYFLLAGLTSITIYHASRLVIHQQNINQHTLSLISTSYAVADLSAARLHAFSRHLQRILDLSRTKDEQLLYSIAPQYSWQYLRNGNQSSCTLNLPLQNDDYRIKQIEQAARDSHLQLIKLQPEVQPLNFVKPQGSSLLVRELQLDHPFYFSLNTSDPASANSLGQLLLNIQPAMSILGIDYIVRGVGSQADRHLRQHLRWLDFLNEKEELGIQRSSNATEVKNRHALKQNLTTLRSDYLQNNETVSCTIRVFGWGQLTAVQDELSKLISLFQTAYRSPQNELIPTRQNISWGSVKRHQLLPRFREHNIFQLNQLTALLPILQPSPLVLTGLTLLNPIGQDLLKDDPIEDDAEIEAGDYSIEAEPVIEVAVPIVTSNGITVSRVKQTNGKIDWDANQITYYKDMLAKAKPGSKPAAAPLNTRLVVGTVKENSDYAWLVGTDIDSTNLHMLISGGTGSGKTIAVAGLLHQLTRYLHGIFVLEPGNSLSIEVINNMPIELERYVRYMNHTRSERVPSFNIMARTGNESTASIVLRTVEFIERILNINLDTTLNISIVLTSSLTTVIDAVEQLFKRPATLRDLMEFVSNEYVREWWTEKTLNRDTVKFWNSFSISFSKNERLATFLRIYIRLRTLLTSEYIDLCLAQPHPTINFRLEGDARNIVLISMPVEDGVDNNALLALCNIMISRQMMSRDPMEIIKHPELYPYVHLIADEAPQYLTKQVNQNLVTIRKYNVCLYFLIQYLTQLIEKGAPDGLLDAMQTNAQTKIIFPQESLKQRKLALEAFAELTEDDFRKLPDDSAGGVKGLPRYHGYANLLLKRVLQKPAMIATLTPMKSPEPIVPASPPLKEVLAGTVKDLSIDFLASEKGKQLLLEVQAKITDHDRVVFLEKLPEVEFQQYQEARKKQDAAVVEFIVAHPGCLPSRETRILELSDRQIGTPVYEARALIYRTDVENLIPAEIRMRVDDRNSKKKPEKEETGAKGPGRYRTVARDENSLIDAGDE